MRIILRILGTLIIAVTLTVSALIIVPGFLGYTVQKVETTSMEPVIRKNSLIYIQKTVPEEIAVGDVILFEGTEHTEMRRVVINHLVSEDFTVKGDAYMQEDRERVPYTALIGCVTDSIPIVGNILFAYQSGIGRIYISALFLCGVLMIALSLLTKKPEKKKVVTIS